MRIILSSWLAMAAGAVLVAGCSSSVESVFTPTGGRLEGDLNKLDGLYGGTANYARGPDYCARRLNISLTVRNGRFEGELRDPRTPNATPARFDGSIEFDGAAASIVRAGGDVLLLRGRFLEGRFSGTMLPEASVDPTRENPRAGRTNLVFGTFDPYCNWMVRLPRQPA